jgi:hypothetical protein
LAVLSCFEQGRPADGGALLEQRDGGVEVAVSVSQDQVDQLAAAELVQAGVDLGQVFVQVIVVDLPRAGRGLEAEAVALIPGLVAQLLNSAVMLG